jgi:hypothetical protein
MGGAGERMDLFFRAYITAWAAACGIAVVLLLQRRSVFAIARRTYWHFLVEPWKLLTFLASAALVTLVAPYTGDPTWDYVDGLFMSVLCYVSAPWVVATLFFAVRGKVSVVETYVAVCAWLFSASWSYDIYLVWRDGGYPNTWFANLFASSVIYLSAGMFWNLEWQAGRGVIFSFMRDNWPSRPSSTPVWRLAIYAGVLALPVIAAVLMFFL